MLLGDSLDVLRSMKDGSVDLIMTSQPTIDYLFHRMFAIIRLLLKSSGRGG